MSWTFAERLRAVKLHLEEGFSQQLVASEMGVSSAAVYKWTKQYRLYGEAGLKSKVNGAGRLQLPEPVRHKILELKKEKPREPQTRPASASSPLPP